MSILDKLQVLIEENRLTDQVAWSAFSQVQRYRRFLELLSLQYVEPSREYLACRRCFFLDDPAEAWTLEDQKRGDELAHILELQIESFYMFAKILLDNIAASIERRFGSARGLPLGSHDKLVKNLHRYAASQHFGVRDTLWQQAQTLKLRVSEFRDKSIVHLHKGNPHISGGVGLDEDGRITLAKLRKVSAAGDWQVAESSEITQLLALLDSYILAVLPLLRLLPATVTSLSPLKVTADGSKTEAPARKDPAHVYSVNDRVLLRLHTPYAPFVVGLLKHAANGGGPPR